MIFLLSLFCLFQSYLAGEIKVVYTAALLDSFYEERKIEYLRSLQALRKLHITPYIVESCRTSSFFDKERAFVFYSQTNDTSLKNKGINEAISLQKAMDYYRFHDEDILIKLTGRYCFLNGHFFSEIRKHPEKDAFVKKTYIHPYPLSEIDYFTGCFALKCCYFKRFLAELDFSQMEKDQTPIEWELGKFLQRHPEIRVHEISKIHLQAHVFGSGYTGSKGIY